MDVVLQPWRRRAVLAAVQVCARRNDARNHRHAGQPMHDRPAEHEKGVLLSEPKEHEKGVLLTEPKLHQLHAGQAPDS